MGTTLQHGIFLPAEGERNCYAGLASNWTILDGVVGGYSAHAANLTIHVTAADKEAWNGKADASALTAHTGDTTIHVTAADKEAWNGKADASALTAHTGNTTIHVTAADKEAWNGKADASALTAHTGNTTIHVTAEDKTKWDAVTSKADASALTAHTGDTTIHVTAEDKAKWDAVTSKANDADAVHKSREESIAGLKTFTDLMSIDGDYLGTEASNNQRTNICLRANRDTADKSCAYITRFRQNRAQGALGTSDLQMIGFDVLENEVRTNNVFSIQCSGWVDNVPTKVKIISSVSDSSFGTSTRPFKINGINPGALSLPDLTAGVDISGYLTSAGTTTPSEYTPTVDGWLVLAISADSPAFIRVFSNAGMDTTAYSERNEIGSTSGATYTRYAALTVPCRQNDKQNIIIMPSTMGIVKAMFYPCTGNV